MKDYVLSTSGICKAFAGNKVLKNVDFQIKYGEVVGLVGENGAGKSTLMKIITGVYSMDSGEILLDGRKVSFENPLEALAGGVAIIHQELNLFRNLSVYENIYLNRKEYRDNLGRINRKKMESDALEILKMLGADINASVLVENLSIREQQVVEIARAVSANTKVLIMDEPSAALTEEEVQKMFAVIRKLKEQGVAVIYASHRMNEIKQICDRVVVLRDGKNVGTLEMADSDIQDIVTMMVGREISDFYPKTEHTIGEAVMEVKDLSCRGVHHASFQVKSGEIVCLYGLAGSGITELAECIFGIEKARGGEVRVGGIPLHHITPAKAIEHGIAYVPADRRGEGIIADMSIEKNLILASYEEDSRLLFLKRKQIAEETGAWRKRLNIRSTGGRQRLMYLSGGNQQKVVLAKWLKTRPKILILNEPTRGVDIGAKAEIYAQIDSLANEGLAVLLISSEVPEVLGMGDRVIIMNKGCFTGELDVKECNQEVLLRAASGGGIQ